MELGSIQERVRSWAEREQVVRAGGRWERNSGARGISCPTDSRVGTGGRGWDMIPYLIKHPCCVTYLDGTPTESACPASGLRLTRM